MKTSQKYLSCREDSLEELQDMIGKFVTDNFIVPGRDAIDAAISDGEDAENERDAKAEEIAELEQEVEDLKARIKELEAELQEEITKNNQAERYINELQS